ncbi:hypothetical protein [Gottfriedia acidiceleris]|uniref:hypothetical protein n=1 Tax=Gottfriedia acidiceleris TaxID=371036 RepID=UPI00101B7B63|nr:hypothetical protein [Gottfriedia acidiceleris]
MKRYFSWEDEYTKGTTYIEVENGYAIKQIAVTQNKYIASNRKDKEHHYFLAEGLLDVNEIIDDGGSEISEKEFYVIWNKHSEVLINTWNITKEKYPIGLEVEGKIEVFYPQGVIVNFAENVIGVVDYIKCKESTQPENLYPHHKITGKVNGYDEENMWLIIDNPKVF